MTTGIDDGDVRILHGDALEQLATLPSESVHCIVTSPPFWALRDYGAEGQIGLEATPEEWCNRLVDVFRECRRVLRTDGVMWLECGDTYSSSGERSHNGWDGNNKNSDGSARTSRHAGTSMGTANAPGVKPKDLVGAPWMLAFALRQDGWYLRSDTIWARPNPMPESVADRPTKAHSYVFLLTKSARYYYDADAIREEAQYGYSGTTKGEFNGRDTFGEHNSRTIKPGDGTGGRNARSVWTIPTEPTPFAHFATFPQALVERCIKAGTSEHGACAECGAPWVRVTTLGKVTATGGSATGARASNMDSVSPFGQDPTNGAYNTGAFIAREHVTTGWVPSCTHDAPITPCTVLDPFMGSGTTALVARRLGRHAIGIELNADYIAIAATRLQQLSLLGEAHSA